MKRKMTLSEIREALHLPGGESAPNARLSEAQRKKIKEGIKYPTAHEQVLMARSTVGADGILCPEIDDELTY